MAATFSFYHVYGTTPSTELASTGNSLNFFGGTSSVHTAVYEAATGTANYNNTGSNIQAGSNSWPIWITGRFSAGGAATFNNIKFWRYTESAGSDFHNATASMNVFATVVAATAAPTSRATSVAQASNSACPTASSSTSTSGGNTPLSLGSVSTAGAGSCVAGSYIVYQLTTATNAAAGDTPLAAFTMQYDEQ